MFAIFKLKKLAIFLLLALVAKADSMHCDSKETMIAFAKETCNLTESQARELAEKRIYSDLHILGEKGEWKQVALEKNRLICIFPGKGNDFIHLYSDFTLIKDEGKSLKCGANLMLVYYGKDFYHNIEFTLKNALVTNVKCDDCSH